jgi:two-component sensor histidine kinase
VRTLVDASGGAARRVDVSVKVNAAPAPAALAVPLALFIVEATTNALKHAFPDERDGLIEIAVEEDAKTGLMHVAVRDDGVGLPAVRSEGRTGSSLMTAFARQLGGTTTLANAPGGGVVVTVDVALAAVSDPLAEPVAHTATAHPAAVAGAA